LERSSGFHSAAVTEFLGERRASFVLDPLVVAHRLSWSQGLQAQVTLSGRAFVRLLTRTTSAGVREFNPFDPIHRLEAPLLVERAGGGVMSVEVAKEALELRHFLIANVVPYLEDGTVRPEISFASAMAAEPAANSALLRHPDVHDLVSLTLAASRRNAAIQDVDASHPRRQPRNVVNRDVFETTLNQPESALGHVRTRVRREAICSRRDAWARSSEVGFLCSGPGKN
jgi:hypothetical protein